MVSFVFHYTVQHVSLSYPSHDKKTCAKEKKQNAEIGSAHRGMSKIFAEFAEPFGMLRGLSGRTSKL